MRFLFAFGFLCASTLLDGMLPRKRPPRARNPRPTSIRSSLACPRAPAAHQACNAARALRIRPALPSRSASCCWSGRTAGVGPGVPLPAASGTGAWGPGATAPAPDARVRIHAGGIAQRAHAAAGQDAGVGPETLLQRREPILEQARDPAERDGSHRTEAPISESSGVAGGQSAVGGEATGRQVGPRRPIGRRERWHKRQ